MVEKLINKSKGKILKQNSMANDRNAGRPPKFKKGGDMKTLQRKIPVKGFKEISEAVDKTINQFKDYDWT